MTPRNTISNDAFQFEVDDKINKSIDPGLWIDFSTDDVVYWVYCGPTDCQRHDGPFDKSW